MVLMLNTLTLLDFKRRTTVAGFDFENKIFTISHLRISTYIKDRILLETLENMRSLRCINAYSESLQCIEG